MQIILLRKNISRFITLTLMSAGISYANPTFGNLILQTARVTLSVKNIPLEEVFKKIKQQTGITIYNNFEETQLDGGKKVSINFIKTDISEVMALLLNDKTNLSFLLNRESILIFKKNKAVQYANLKDTLSKSIQFTGKIIDADGNPIPGASLKIKNSTKGTMSNSDGSFRLSGINKGTAITITSIGYESQEISANTTNTLIKLKKHTNLLDEKVIIAYGSTTRRLNTGNISSIKAKDLENQPVNNPMLALQGRTPGIFIEQASGLPGSGVTIRIQGRNSMNNGNDPFFVIDGVPYVSQLLPTYNSIIGGSGGSGIPGNPLSYLNTADIESIEILKDADATAIYGSRAANGAVLITTKKGISGPIRAQFTIQNGFAKVPKEMKLLNTKDYLAMRHEALKNDGVTISPFDWDLNGTWDTTRDVNWQKELIGNSAQYTDAQFNVSGGNAFTQFMFGAGYHKETTVFPGPFDYKNGSVHLNLNSNSANQKFKFQFTGSYLFNDNRLPLTDLTNSAITLAPVAPNPYNPDGTINWMPDANGSTTYYANPIASNVQKSNSKTNNLISNAILSYEIIPGLILKSSFGFNNLATNEIVTAPASSTVPEYRQYVSNTSIFTSNKINSWIIEPQIEYKRAISKGNLNILLGSTVTQQNNDQQKITARGFSNELIMEDLSSATNIAGSNINSVYKYSALYGRITYNWADKYIIDLTSRRDGSSRFGIENQFHNFGAIGAAWIFSQEPFIQSHLPILSFGKLRGSYGTTGSDQIGDYSFMDVYQSIYVSGNSYQGITGLSPTRLTNPYLQWEETKKLQFGLELGFLKDKILFTANYNRNRSGNQLTQTNLPTITGFFSIAKNYPAVIQNTGWEFTLGTTNIKTKNFYWNTNFNITIPQNKMISYFGLDKNTSVSIGKPLSTMIYYNYNGVNEQTGKYEFIDAKGNLTTKPADPQDKTVALNGLPKFYGGLQNSLSYKGVSLDIFFLFTKRSALDQVTYGMKNLAYPGFFNGGASNQSTAVLNRWQKPGDNTQLQPYSAGKNTNLTYIRSSNAVFKDASFIRLKNIALSWQLPDYWKKVIHLQNARIFVNAQNILTITKYKGLDPETGLSLPPLRVITAGIQITI